MARLSTYAIDGTPVSSDKLIGTDSAGTVTKNYPLGDVADWLKSSGATAVLGQNNYLFQIALDPDEGRKIGSFSFENYGGDGTAFEDVTNLKFSASSSAGKYIADYLLSTVDQKIMLSQLDDPNSFGIYVLASLVQSSLEPTFYDATLAVVSSNGILRGNKSYGLATYSALNEAGGGTWGSITGTITNQTDLVDYIDAEIAAIPTPATPTLQSVTDEGNTTTNSITAQSINLDAENIGGIYNSTYSDVNILPKSNAFEFNVRTSSSTGKLRISTDGSLYLASNANSIKLGRLHSGQYPKGQLELGLNGSGYTAFFDRDGVNELMRIDGATENVGIGTTAPTEKLQVLNSVMIGERGFTSFSDGRLRVASTTDYGEIGFSSKYDNFPAGIRSYAVDALYERDLRFYTKDTISAADGNLRMIITGSGNVGIGTTSPSQPLHVATNNNNSTLALRISNEHTGGRAGVSFNLPNISNEFYSVGVDNDRYFKISNGANLATNTRVVISTVGNVGIGTTAPTRKLEVNGDIGMQLGDNLRWGSQLGIRKDSNGELNFFAGTNSTSGGFNFRGWNGSAYESGTLVIRNNGNVGIGTTAPTAKLEVHQSADSQGLKIVGFDDENDSNLHLFVDNFGNNKIHTTEFLEISAGGSSRYRTTGYLRLEVGGTNNQMQLDHNYMKFTSGGTETMRITPGNVGIGTTSPAVSLDVDGQVHLGPQSTTGFPSIDIASNGRTTIRASAPALSVRDNNNNGGYIDMGNGTLANINSITSAATLTLSTTNMRIGGDIGARQNVIGQDNSTQSTLGLRQGLNSTSTVIDIRNSSNVSTMGITSEGGFYFKDSNLVERFSFDHDYLPSPADGLTVGIDLRTENASGVVSSLGYIDVTQDDISADESSMRLSVGEATPTEVMRLQSNGNVGIGTTAPSDKLEVNTGGVNGKGIKIAYDSSNYVTFSKSTSTNFDIKSFIGGSEYGAIHFGNSVNIKTTNGSGGINFSRGSSTLMRINNDGNVGIGTTAPSEKLQVSGGNILLDTNTWIGSGSGSGQPRLRFDNTNSQGKLQQADLILNDEKSVAWSNTGTSIQGRGVDNQRIEFNVASSERMRITDTGNVGIGTTAPAEKLDVAGKIQSSSDIYVGLYNRLAWGNNGYNYLKFSGGYLNMGYTADAFKFDMNSSTTKSIEMVADSNFQILGKSNKNILLTTQGTGNVGIGTGAPDSKVHISGTAMQQLRMETAGGPSSAGDTSGRIGDMAYDDDFFYIKTASGWGRVQLDFGF